MKRILINLSIIAAVIALAAGGTIAYFSDTETSEGNTFSAGTLDLAVNNENPWTSTLFTISDVKPGDSGSTQIKLENVGTLPKSGGPPWNSKVFITIDLISNDDNGCTEPESEVDSTCGEGKGELAEKLNFRVRDYWDSNCNANLRFDETHSLAEWKNKGKTFLNDDMPAGDVNCVKIDWSIAPSTGNEIQSDSVEFKVTFTLEQTEPWQ